MADEGMRLLSFYSEPACTPTRAALMTGRHPVRIGLLGVLFPGTVGMGVVDEEETVAELLEPENFPINQGFDEAVWSEGNPPWWTFNRNVKPTDNAGYVNIRALAGARGFPLRHRRHHAREKRRRAENGRPVLPGTL